MAKWWAVTYILGPFLVVNLSKKLASHAHHLTDQIDNMLAQLVDI